VNVGENTTLGDGDVSKELVQLLIVADGELEMAGDDTGLLVVASGVASEFEDFSREVLEDGSEVDRGTGTDTLGVVALAEKTVNTTDGERETSLGRAPAKWDQYERAGCAKARRETREDRLTIARSSSQRPCRQTCRRQSF
jgi:hypothetical protein